jgi:hypothetical protein
MPNRLLDAKDVGARRLQCQPLTDEFRCGIDTSRGRRKPIHRTAASRGHRARKGRNRSRSAQGSRRSPPRHVRACGRERVDAEGVERPAFRIVDEVERRAIEDDMRSRFGHGACHRLDVCDVEGVTGMRRDVALGKRRSKWRCRADPRSPWTSTRLISDTINDRSWSAAGGLSKTT